MTWAMSRAAFAHPMSTHRSPRWRVRASRSRTLSEIDEINIDDIDFCFLSGTTKLLDAATLGSLYADNAAYIEAVNTATDDAVEQGIFAAGRCAADQDLRRGFGYLRALKHDRVRRSSHSAGDADSSIR